ncbi:MAG: glycosyl hydrolase 115 family protein, partial [Micrococcales bacterium]|nr:glycosyl hydrolase 115 family protein [Micrococcales bacterium]
MVYASTPGLSISSESLRLGYLADAPTDGLVVATSGRRTAIAFSPGESAAVRRAVDSLAGDLRQVSGCDSQTCSGPGDARIVVGTIGASALIDSAIADGLLDISALTTDGGCLRWEGFLLHVAGDVLYIAGADRRGTIFGIYDFAEAIGVSPWRWWADVPVRLREQIAVRRDLHVADWPSVRYRGVFLNDEEELDAWARAHTPDGTIGPALYERVFELILRLKGNYIWPAMHVNAFNADPGNGRLADEMGIVVGTSHCDMLLRNNQNEWDSWVAGHGECVEYDYSIPGDNRQALRDYWRGSVEQNAGYEVSWTVGMRGVHDSGFVTSAIDADDALTEAAKRRERVRLLARVIDDQRQILAETLGPDRARGAPQIFVPYKEVLPLYDDGLDVPDDVTIVWTDDNFGHVRRYPSKAELTRAGGHGLYYHSSYWSPPSRSYLFCSSMPLAQMKYELGKAFAGGIDRLWVDNIGALKPLELDMEFFLRYAWEAGKETTTADVARFTARWADRMFSGGHGKVIARILTTFAQVTNVRKVEHLRSRAFSQTAYGDEAARRLAVLRSLYHQTNAILATLPEGERDAFFELVALRVHASHLVNAQFSYADRSALAYGQGKWRAADYYLDVSRCFDAHKRAMLHFYNRVMAGGKWDAILAPETFPPPTMALFPAARPALRIGAPGLGVVCWGDEGPVDHPHLDFWPGGRREKWVEVFNTGAGSVDYAVVGDDWLQVTPAAGTVETERRLAVRVADPWAAAGRQGRVEIASPSTGRRVVVTVDVRTVPAPGGA